jgi:WD40 repeat protein
LAIFGCAPLGQTKVNFPFSVQEQMSLPVEGGAVAVAWSPDGSEIAAATNFGGVLTIWNGTGRLISQVKVGSGPNLDGSLAFVRGGSDLVFMPPKADADDVSLSVRDVRSGKVIASVGGANPGRSREFNRPNYFLVSPDQTTLVGAEGVASPYPNVAIFRSPDWRLANSYSIPRGVRSVAFAGASKLAVGSFDPSDPRQPWGVLTIIDLLSKTAPRRFPVFRYGWVGALAASPDGTRAFVGDEGADDVPAYILNVRDGSRLAEFDWTHDRHLNQAQWDPKGRFVVFMDATAGELFFWRPESSDPSYLRLAVPERPFQFEISPDGQRIAIATVNSVLVYRITQ